MKEMSKEIIWIDDNPMIRDLDTGRMCERLANSVVAGTLGSGYNSGRPLQRYISKQLVESYLNEFSRLGGVQIHLEEWNRSINPLNASSFHSKDKKVKQ
jgi:hypothetical protein